MVQHLSRLSKTPLEEHAASSLASATAAAGVAEGAAPTAAAPTHAIEAAEPVEQPLQEPDCAALASGLAEVAARLPRLNLKSARSAQPRGDMMRGEQHTLRWPSRQRDPTQDGVPGAQKSAPAAAPPAVQTAHGPDEDYVPLDSQEAGPGASVPIITTTGTGPASALPAAKPAMQLRSGVASSGSQPGDDEHGEQDAEAAQRRDARVFLGEDASARERVSAVGDAVAAAQMLSLISGLEEELFAAESRRYNAEVRQRICCRGAAAHRISTLLISLSRHVASMFRPMC